ncbi:MAG: hypothetical protein F6K17_09695 [Okeania sp. SIO3C4]|nr:hypothetical protein [Okeania sp. SIO3B3]NER02874.1 hypothetical protein [Okeania sp. SIO3C4]
MVCRTVLNSDRNTAKFNLLFFCETVDSNIALCAGNSSGRQQATGGLTKSEVRSQKSEVKSYFCNRDLSNSPKIFRLKRRGGATQLF